MVNTPELQATLDRLTTKLDRWRQESYCFVPGGIEPLTSVHLDAGRYHDFTLEDETVAYLRERGGQQPCNLPVADCGTAFCVAGDVAVTHDWTFVANSMHMTSNVVVRTADVNRLLRNDTLVISHSVESVARDILDLTVTEGRILFGSENRLIDLWALGYGLSGGTLKLPERLPITTNNPWGDHSVSGLATAADVRAAVMVSLAGAAVYWMRRDFHDAVDFDVLRAVESDRSQDGAWLRFGEHVAVRWVNEPSALFQRFERMHSLIEH